MSPGGIGTWLGGKLCSCSAWRPDSAHAAGTDEFFESKVRPVLAQNCYACHTDTRWAACAWTPPSASQKGGNSGPPIVPGKPDESLLVQAVRQTHEKLKMPPGGKLKDDEIAAIAEWVKAGAVWPAGAPKAPASPPYAITPQQRAFWAFQPVRKPAVPEGERQGLGRNPIDHFILAKLEAQGLKPGASGRQARPDPPRHFRPDRPAADAGRGGRVSGGQVAGRLRQGGGPAARFAALWRALGPLLAGRGALFRRQAEFHRRTSRIPTPSAIAIG